MKITKSQVIILVIGLVVGLVAAANKNLAAIVLLLLALGLGLSRPGRQLSALFIDMVAERLGADLGQFADWRWFMPYTVMAAVAVIAVLLWMTPWWAFMGVSIIGAIAVAWRGNLPELERRYRQLREQAAAAKAFAKATAARTGNGRK